MSEYKLVKSTMERYDIRLQGKDRWRCSWAIISISADGVFNATTDCGDFNYYWGSPGKSFKEFLIDICSKDTSYLYNKISSNDRKGQIDVEKTVESMKKKVIELRRETGLWSHVKGDFSQEEARVLWDALEGVKNDHSEISPDAFSSIFYYELPDTERKKVFSDEWWYDDILVYTEDRSAMAFCEVVAPIFAEILQSEIENSEITSASALCEEKVCS